MFHWVRPHKPFVIVIGAVLVAPLVLIASLLTFDLTSTQIARWRGEFDAYRDVHRGSYVELGYGLPAPWGNNYAALLHNHHPEAKFVPVAGCIFSHQLQAYVDAYDRYSSNAALHHYGRDIFRESANEAENVWRSDHPRSEP